MERFTFGGKVFEPAFRHVNQKTARRAVEGAYIEWVDQIETSRASVLERLDAIELDQVHCERALLSSDPGQDLVRFKNDLDDEEEKLKRRLEDQETRWKQRHGVEVIRDGTSHHLVAFYEGGAESDLRWVRGYVGLALSATRDQDLGTDEPDVEVIKSNPRYL